jgi:glycerol-3-phosphate acyltransferase PlsY
MAIWLGLIAGAYILGSVPVSYLVAKRFYGLDLRKYGTGQMGGGNLWRMTSWRLGLPVGVFDLSKGILMVWLAKLLGLSVAQQIIVGLGAIAGHNWSLFLRFQGGRGFATMSGVVLVLPMINEMTPWPAVAFTTIVVAGTVIVRSSPVSALLGTAALPLVSWRFGEPMVVTLSFLAMFLMIVVKRLSAPGPAETVSRKRLFLNRLLFDRDIKDRKAWMYRKAPGDKPTERPKSGELT